MEHEIFQDNNHCELEIKEARIDYLNVNDFRNTVFSFLEKLPPEHSFILDLRNVNYVSSSCISVLIQIYENYNKKIKYKVFINKKQSKLLGGLALMDHLNVEFED